MLSHVFSLFADNDKMLKLGDNLLMTICGDSGDASQFSEYIAKNIQLYRMRNGMFGLNCYKILSLVCLVDKGSDVA